MSGAAKIGESLNDQFELFLWKWRDVSREELSERLKEFKKFDSLNNGELEENNAMRLLESRGETKTAVELRAMFADMDKNKNHKLSFLEWCCALYKKSYDETNTFVDHEAREAAMLEMRAAAEAAQRVLEEMERARIAEEQAAEARARELERESQLTGVAGMSAFFKRQINNSQDTSMTNEQKIKEEAARRKALREAKQKEKEAKEAAQSSGKTAEEVAEELRIAKEKADREAAEAAEAKAAEEKAARAARKEAMNAKWVK